MLSFFSVLTLLALSLSSAAAAAPPKPTFPAQYTAECTFALPYARLEESLMVWYDSINNMQRVDYYGGLNTYLYRGDLNNSYQIVPMGAGVMGCLSIAGPPQLQSVFPDLTSFTYQGTATIDGVDCHDWMLVVQDGSRNSTYHFYVSTYDYTPVQYHMLGYDSLFGSHYDEYILRYSFVSGVVDVSSFNVRPNLKCSPFFGDSNAIAALRELAALHPQTASHRAADAHIDRAFEQFKRKHGKRYPSKTEHAIRRSNFAHNLRFIQSTNRAGLSYKLAANHLADRSPRELRRRLNGQKRPANSMADTVHSAPSRGCSSLPPAWDWRDSNATTPVKDQGDCGSCWSFGSSETIESSLYLATKQMRPLSSQFLVDCTWQWGNTGCDGGQDFLAYRGIQSLGGIPTEADYPYLMADGRCHSVPFATNITGFVNVSSANECALMDALYNVGPISISIDASHDSFSFYSSGVYYEPQCGSSPDALDHSVLLVGYGTDPTGGDYWIVKNSWSTHWGDSGYVKMARRDNNCGVETAPTYALLQ